MAEIEEREEVESTSATADNVETSPDTSESTSTEERAPELWTELGYANPDELKQTHTRYKQQIAGSQQEVQRLRDEIAGRDREIGAWRAQQQQGQQQGTQQGGGQQAQPTQFRTVQQAYEAYLDGDATALERWDQGQQARIQQAVVSTLQTAVRPNQYSDMVVSKYPDLAKPESALYKAVYERYASYAADPRWALHYQQDPLAVREANAPDGSGSQRVDMRIVDHLANEIRYEMARDEGRKDEARRRGAAGGSSPTASGGTPTNTEPNAWALMSSAEKAEIEHQIAARQLPDDWPKSKEAVAKKLVDGWKKRDPAQVTQRVEQFRAGVPIRVR